MMLAGRGIYLLLLGFLLSPAAVAASEPAPVSILGRQHIRVSDWAQRAGLQMRWLKQDESLQLSNSRFTIRLTVNSSESVVNGIGVRLLFPIAAHNGAPYLTQLDVENTFRPVLFPPVNRPGTKIRTICIDPGHGGNDPGYKIGGREEKALTLLLAQELGSQLAKAGFKISFTRTKDKRIELP